MMPDKLGNVCSLKNDMLDKLKIFTGIKFNRVLFLILGSIIFFFCNLSVQAQSKTPAVKVSSSAGKLHANKLLSINSTSIIQELSFGEFCTGNSGGMVIMPCTGSRSATGDIVLIPSDQGSPAIIQITVDNTDYITITTGSVINLTNSSGGSLTLQINDFYPASPFNPVIGLNNIKIGGTLTVGSAANTPPGNYNGSLEVIFNEQ
jgi:hypothetical protein